MMGIVWLIAHLVTAAAAAQDTPLVSVGSCTYVACMEKCSGLNGPACSSYCELKISQRVERGLCPALVDPDEFAGD